MTAEFGLDTAHGGYDIFMRTTEPFHCRGRERVLAAGCEGEDSERATTRSTRVTTKAGSAPPVPLTRLKTNTPSRNSRIEPPTCLIHDTPLDRVSEESYFFRLSDYDEALLEFYEHGRISFDPSRGETK